ncbi:MAG TPA: toll/interleukin-1 receptor domain-containing protein [Bryobacteraceae bacterium]|nr:toll/interleukin-1 receptor domain-containing protein [Bryobacteraceae bacterium]
MPGVFICYRREDASPYAGRLYDHISARFGAQRVFMDIDTIRPGDDFVQVIADRVAVCDALIAVIGRNWLSSVNSRGQRRLDDPNDYVRIEIATALARNVRVIPALVDGAAMPQANQLPPDLASLARRNAIEISNAMFRPSVERLIGTLEETVRPNPLSFPRMLKVKPKQEQAAKEPRPRRTIIPALRLPVSWPGAWWPVLVACVAFFFLQMLLGGMTYRTGMIAGPLLHAALLFLMLSVPFVGGGLDRISVVKLTVCWLGALYLRNTIGSVALERWPLPQYEPHYRIPPSSGFVLVLVEPLAALIFGALVRFMRPATAWGTVMVLAQVWAVARLVVWLIGNASSDGVASPFVWALDYAAIGASTIWMVRQFTPAPAHPAP